MKATIFQRGVGAAAITIALGVSSSHAAFSANTLVVVRLGDGVEAVTDVAQQVYLDEYSLVDGSLVAAHALPAAGPSAFTLSGRGDHDGHLNLSTDGRYLTLGGYRADAGAANPVLQSPTVTPRVIARVDANWSANTSTALTDAYEYCDITAVATNNGQHFWTAGEGKYLDLVNGDPEYDWKVPTITGGLRYVDAVGATTSTNVSQTQTIPINPAVDAWPDSIRNTRIVDGQVYINTPAWESFGYRGAYATADPLPTTGPQAMTPVITNAPPSADTKGKFVPKSDSIFLDLDPTVPGMDTAYSTGGKADYQKWSLVAGEWIRLSNELLVNESEEINAFDAILDGDIVTLFAATDQGIYRLIDSAGYNAAPNDFFSAAFITADFNTEFRGLALVPEPTGLVLFTLAGAALVARRRRSA